MNWHVTWQDGAALFLALVGLGFSWWLYRKFARPGGCAKCPILQEPVTRPTDRASAGSEAPPRQTS